MKTVHNADEAVSELVGTLLLIAITVILMATIGLFLITNLPTGNPVKAEMEITATQENNGRGQVYLVSIDQVTENIKLRQIELDLSIRNYYLPVIVGFTSNQTIFQKPVIVQVINTGIYNIKNITMANSSTGFRLYLPDGTNLTYVSVVDLQTNSVIAQSPVKASAVSYSKPQLVAVEQCEIYGTSKATQIEYSQPQNYFEYNVSSFSNVYMNKTERNFFNNTSTHSNFLFTVLKSNSSAGKGYELNISSFIYIPSGNLLNLTLLTSEPVNVSIISDSGYYKIESAITGQSNFYLTNKTFSGKGIFEIYINYSFAYVNGLLDVMLKSSSS
ncbi:type IV pilin [Cuniculiplasma sp. SKW4]|uniref:type IV pilin n=1 Tax=Cuniculiplasma sp. SKW4 TaxID=3400171 RepID=UPI003FD3542F